MGTISDWLSSQKQLGTFFFCHNRVAQKGTSLVSFSRKQNIIRAQKEGLEVGTEIMDVGGKIVVIDATPSGMILRRIVVDKASLGTGILLIGADA